MIDLSKLKDGIIICPNSLKTELVKYKSIFNINKNFKFLSKEDLIKGFYFSYDINALYYVHKTYGYNYSLTKEILNNLYNISPINDKLKILNNIYEDLIKNNLLKNNPYFIYLFNNKKVYIVGYSKKDAQLLSLIKKLTNNYEYLNEEITSNNELEVIYFKDIETEVNYVMCKIGELIKNGVSLNKIYFYKVPSEYKLILKKALFNHNIILDTGSDINLYDTPIFKKYLALLNNYSFIDAYQLLKEQTVYDPLDVLGSLVSLIIDVTSLKIEKDEQIELLCFLATNTSVEGPSYEEVIKEIDDSYYFTDDEYCFMLGFSLGSYPVIIRDTAFYLDSERVLLNQNPSYIENKINEERLCNFIRRTKNLFITFKEKDGKNVYYLSLLTQTLNMKVVNGIIGNKRYSKKYTEFEVSKYYDLNRLYGVKNKWMTTFDENEIEFNRYNHAYKKIQNFNFSQEIVLSYSQINDYIECPYKFYLKHILNIDEFIGNYKTEIGTLFHKILEDANTTTINLDSYQEEINNRFETYKDKYFAVKNLPQVLKVIKKNSEFNATTMLNNITYEKEIKIKLDDSSSLLGRVDKFFVDEISKTICVVDYKTGKFTFNKKLIELGLNLQLPIYALLLKEEFPDYKIAGVYIQKVLINCDNIKEQEAYLLDGITLNDLNVIKLIDPTLGNIFDENGKGCPASIYLRGIKIKKTGELYSSSPVVDHDELISLLEITKTHVLNTLEGIKKAQFNISPLNVKEEKSNACTYCKFADICNHDTKDTRIVSLKEGKE